MNNNILAQLKKRAAIILWVISLPSAIMAAATAYVWMGLPVPASTQFAVDMHINIREQDRLLAEIETAEKVLEHLQGAPDADEDLLTAQRNSLNSLHGRLISVQSEIPDERLIIVHRD